jgi:hypothetical protein
MLYKYWPKLIGIFFFCVHSVKGYAYHCGCAPLRPSDSDIAQNMKSGLGRFLYSFNNPKGLLGDESQAIHTTLITHHSTQDPLILGRTS